MSTVEEPRLPRNPARLARALAVVGRVDGIVVAGACAVALLLVFLFDVLSPGDVTVGALGFIPVVVVGWLVSFRITAGVTVFAVAFRVLAVLLGSLQPLTGFTQAGALAAVGLLSHLVASGVIKAWRADTAQRTAVLEHRDEQLRRRVAELSLLLDAAQMLTSSLDLERIYQTAARLAAGIGQRTAPGKRRGALLEVRGERVVRVAAHDELDLELRPSEAPIADVPLLNRVLVTGQAATTSDLEAAGDVAAAAAGASVTGAAMAPVYTRGGIFGALVTSSREPVEFDEAELRVLEGLAQLVGLAIGNAESLRHQQVKVEEVTSLLEAARALGASLELESVLQEAVRLAANIVLRDDPPGRRRASIFRVDRGIVTLVAEHDDLDRSARGIEFPLESHPGMAAAYRSGRPAVGKVKDLGDDFGDRGLQLTRAVGVRAGVYAPIRSGGELFGILALASREDRDFTGTELRLAEGMANLAGLAIGNAERLRLELERAHELRQHAARAAALEQAKAEFLRLASHELRGPLAVVRGYVAMLEEGAFGDISQAQRGVFPVITEKLSDMNLLIDQMLETARLEDSQLQLAPERVDLREAVREAAEKAELGAGHPHRILVSDQDASLPVMADRSRLNTILVNLLDNALKYSPDGGSVQCVLDRQDGIASVAIADEGLGISPEDLPRLFSRFGRIVTPDNSHIPGTGLGLYLARELARMHGGDIVVASEPGRGSVFTLKMPVAQ